jgi:outer membrane receptor protein involved in Fe transport
LTTVRDYGLVTPVLIAKSAGLAFGVNLLVVAVAFPSSARADEPAGAPAPVMPPLAEPPAYETVVTATTPVHGSHLPREQVPANVRTIKSTDLADHHSLDLSDYLSEAIGSFNVNSVQGNPLQPDLQYRGFLASPLLGAPQGLSMYLDGVRLNEPFGDTINWDLIPSNAIRSVNVIPGSNPVFGLNTLGGALSLETKNGFSDPGAEGTLLYGSFNRKLARASAGAHGDRFAIFAAAQVFDEDGWRQFSPTSAQHAFLAGSYANAGTTVDLTLLGASTNLTGNATAPEQLLALDRSAVFTVPDQTKNRLFMATLRGERPLSTHLRLSGTAYLRTNGTRSVNGDQREWSECMAMPGVLCSPGKGGMEMPVVDRAGMPVPFMDTYNAAENRTETRQTSYGMSGQLAVDAPVAGRQNHLFVGADGGQSRIRFRSQTTVGTLDDNRNTVDAGFLDPSSPIAVDSVVNQFGLYASDTFALREDLFLMLSGRFNLTSLSLEDQLGDQLTGEHRFNRFNPSAGISYQPRPWFGAYASYGESSRAPTAVELTCASPTDPCRLPNAFAADPPLAQVVARTFEAGVRGVFRRGAVTLDYDLAAFRTNNANDILFFTSGMVANRGYFSNVGDTRRQGLEADFSGRKRFGGANRGGANRIEWSLHYTLTNATFETSPDAMNGTTNLPKGAHLPSIPRHVGKIGLSVITAIGLSAGVNVIANSGQYLRGDEANLLAPLDGYLIVNGRLACRFWSHASAFVLVNNIFNARYSTFGVLGDATEVLGPTYDSRRFVGPGAPRSAWVGLDFNI